MSTRQQTRAKESEKQLAAKTPVRKSSRGSKAVKSPSADTDIAKPVTKKSGKDTPKNVNKMKELMNFRPEEKPQVDKADVSEKADSSPSLSAGRSARKRMPNKRFQDMEMDFGKKPSPQKAKKRKLNTDSDIGGTDESSENTRMEEDKDTVHDHQDYTTKFPSVFPRKRPDKQASNKTLVIGMQSLKGNAKSIDEVNEQASCADVPQEGAVKEPQLTGEKNTKKAQQSISKNSCSTASNSTDKQTIQSLPKATISEPISSKEGMKTSNPQIVTVTGNQKQPSLLVQKKTATSNTPTKSVSLLSKTSIPPASAVKSLVTKTAVGGVVAKTSPGVVSVPNTAGDSTKIITFTTMHPTSSEVSLVKTNLKTLSPAKEDKSSGLKNTGVDVTKKTDEVGVTSVDTNVKASADESTSAVQGTPVKIVSAVSDHDSAAPGKGKECSDVSNSQVVNSSANGEKGDCGSNGSEGVPARGQQTDTNIIVSEPFSLSASETPVKSSSSSLQQPLEVDGKDSEKEAVLSQQSANGPDSSDDKDTSKESETSQIIGTLKNSEVIPQKDNIQVIEITKEQAESGQILVLTSNKEGEQNILMVDNLPTNSSDMTEAQVVKPKTQYMAVNVNVDSETHTQYITFECTQCNYVTDKKTNFYKHRAKHSDVKRHYCSFDGCDYRAKSTSNLRRHMMIHENKRDYDCPLCDLKFRQKIHVDRHVKYRHQEKQVKCPLCKYTCANENPDLKLHMRRKHQPRPTIPSEGINCGLCDFVAATRKDLQQHLKFHRKGPEMKLFCEHCSFVTDCKSRLKRHILTHTQEKPFSCGICNYMAAQKEHVLRHMKSKHGVELPSGSKKKRRMEPVVDEPNSFYTNVDKKIFACNFCTMKFEKVYNLYKHLHQQHLDSMPQERPGSFSCVVCDFNTNRKNNLLVHMRKHNVTSLDDDDQVYPGGQVYSCVLCNYVNPKRRNLYMHMKKKHKICIMVRRDGSANCIVEENSPVTIVTKGKEVPEVETEEADVTSVQQVSVVTDTAGDTRYVDITELTSSLTTRKDINAPPAVAAEVQVQHEAAEAIEGLQALSEYKGIIAPSAWTTPIVSGGEVTETTTVATTVPAPVNETPRSNIQLSQEQLTQLSSGDYIEINGEMYKVEFSEENQTAAE